jgi:hypothetical protein
MGAFWVLPINTDEEHPIKRRQMTRLGVLTVSANGKILMQRFFSYRLIKHPNSASCANLKNCDGPQDLYRFLIYTGSC